MPANYFGNTSYQTLTPGAYTGDGWEEFVKKKTVPGQSEAQPQNIFSQLLGADADRPRTEFTGSDLISRQYFTPQAGAGNQLVFQQTTRPADTRSLARQMAGEYGDPRQFMGIAAKQFSDLLGSQERADVAREGFRNAQELERMRGQSAREVAQIAAGRETDTLERGAQRDVAARRSQLRKELAETVKGWNEMDATTQTSRINQHLLEEFQGMPGHLKLIPKLPTRENQVTVGPEISGPGAPPPVTPRQRVYSDPKLGTTVFGAAVQGGRLQPEAMRAALAGPEALRGLTDADLDLLAEQIHGATGGGMSAAQDLATFLTRLGIASGKMNFGGLPITETRGGATGGYNVGGDYGMWFPGQRVRTFGGLLMPGAFGAPSPEQMTGTDLQGRVLGRLFRRIYGQ